VRRSCVHGVIKCFIEYLFCGYFVVWFCVYWNKVLN